MIGRRTFVSGLLAAVAPVTAVGAQQAGRVYRVGFLHVTTSSPPSTMLRLLRRDLQRLGWVEGRNFTIETRWAENVPERLPGLIAELAALKPDIIIAVAPAAIRAAKAGGGNIPIVAVDLETDPVAAGFVDSLARPTGSLTGVFLDHPELAGKWLQLLADAVPGLAIAGVIWDSSSPTPQVDAIGAAARMIGVRLLVRDVRAPDDIDRVVDAVQRGGARGVVLLSSPMFRLESRRVSDLAARHRLPAISPFREFADTGGLMSYGPNLEDLFGRAASLVDKILKGARPADLPVERAGRFDFVINLRAAKALGLALPAALLLRADELIE